MEFQSLINLLAGAAIGATGWFARRLWDAVETLRADLSKLREELPKTYLTRDDFKEGVTELKQLLIAIDTKLDRKQDKP